MLDLEFLINNPYFEKQTLEKLEVLFDEWDLDDNLYILKKWSLSVEKYTTVSKNESKQLATLKVNDIFWEGSLKNSEKKQVKIKALEESIIFKINAKKGVEEFIRHHPSEWINLLTEIINLSNKRLLESNFLVISSYKISKSISELTSYNNKNLFKIIEEFKNVLWVDFLLYIEKNPVIESYLTLKYDTRKKWKMQNFSFDLEKNTFTVDSLKDNWIELSWKEHIELLKNKNSIIWYLIIWDSKQVITELQKKAISSISTLIAWIVIQKQIFEDQQNEEYIKL